MLRSRPYDLRLACELIELAVRAAPDSRTLHGARVEIYEAPVTARPR